MRNISKMADHRAKRTKVWDSGSYSIFCRVLLMPDSLGLVWGHSVHFLKFLILRVSKRYSFNSVHQNSTKLLAKYYNEGLI